MPLARRKMEEEIVEDSEPEREAARQASKTADIVIDISDDSEVESSPPIQRKDISVIEISDSSIELPPQKAAGPPRYFIDLGGYNSDPELDMTLPQLRIAKYVHSGPTVVGPSKPKNATSHAIRAMSTSAHTPSVAGKGPLAKNLIQRLADEFGDSMSRLLECVSCDLTWTTRKSIPQKLSHMKSCAKKYGIEDDTLVDLVRKGIEKTPSIQLKGKGKTTAVEASAQTYFDKVMDDATSKKRSKRQEVMSTVKAVEETRDAILSKARVIVTKGDSGTRAIREFSQHIDMAVEFMPSSTPRFGKSTLAGRPGLQARSMFHNDGESPESSPASPELPLPSTLLRSPPSIRRNLSSSPPSSLPPAPENNHQVLVDMDANRFETPIEKSHSILPKFRSHSPHLIYVSSSSSSNPASPAISDTLNSPPLTPSPQKPNSSTFFNRPPPSLDEDEVDKQWGAQYADEAYLYYDLDNESHSPKRDLAQTPSRRSRRSKSRSHSCSPSPAPAPRRGKKDGSTTSKIIFDEKWEEGLKDKILQDTKLHLRILRFEPIPFGIFLSMADTSEDSRPSGKLKFHLREFLDKQVINFYGAEGPAGRRRH